MPNTKSIPIEIDDDARMLMIAASVSGKIGDQAYKTLLSLSPSDMESVARFLNTIAKTVRALRKIEESPL